MFPRLEYSFFWGFGINCFFGGLGSWMQETDPRREKNLEQVFIVFFSFDR